VQVKVIGVDTARRRVSLSLKQLTSGPGYRRSRNEMGDRWDFG